MTGLGLVTKCGGGAVVPRQIKGPEGCGKGVTRRYGIGDASGIGGYGCTDRVVQRYFMENKEGVFRTAFSLAFAPSARISAY